MDKQNATNENLFTRMNNLFSITKEKELIEKELTLDKILDKAGGIFNLDDKDNIFGISKEQTIFDSNNIYSVQDKKPKESPAPATSMSKNNQSILDPEIIENFKSQNYILSPNLGNIFNQIC